MMRFSSFPSFIGLLLVLSAAAPILAFASSTHDHNNYRDPKAILELNSRFSESYDLESRSDVNINSPHQHRNHRRLKQVMSVTDPNGTQFTMDEISKYEDEIKLLGSKNVELSKPRTTFINSCIDNLLSQPVIEDKLISQVDAANFFTSVCIDAGICPEGNTIPFQALDHRLQLAFVRFNCPLRFGQQELQQCLNELLAQEKKQYGYVIKPNQDMLQLQDNVKGLCALFWEFGQDYHGGTDAPTTRPLSSPSIPPTESPTKSQSPTASPTQVVSFDVQFTYIIGLNDAEITASSLDGDPNDLTIMINLRETIREILALDDITRNGLRKLIGFRNGDAELSSITHTYMKDENSCPKSFTESISCVRIVTKVIVYANADAYSVDAVAASVSTPIRNSMEGNNVFLELMDIKPLKEIQYVGDGKLLSTNEELGASKRNRISDGETAGIATAAAVFVVAVALFALARSRSVSNRDEVNSESQSSDVSYNLDLEPEITVVPSSRDAPKGSSRALQLDLNTGEAVPAITSASSDIDSNYSESDQEAGICMKKLGAAVSVGNWAAVSAIAGYLSTDDEASTMASINTSNFSDAKGRYSLNKEDSERAATIDRLIIDGDWNAVGTTAAAFNEATSNVSSSILSEIGSEISFKKVSGSLDGTKRSVLDFIAGPWQSSPAAKATAKNDSEELNSSAQSDAISSLSGAPTPDRHRDVDEEVGLSAFQPTMKNPRNVSESVTTDGDTSPMLRKPKKRGWKGRLTGIRKKVNVDKTAAKSLALQEDSSVSSWSVGSPGSGIFAPYSSLKPKMGDDMPAEMKVFGEDFGLGAAELAMRQEEEGKDTSDDETISRKSTNSLHDELDIAIETGNWTALESQTNYLFQRNKNDLEETPVKRNSVSSHGDSDNNIREEWSTSSKSMESGHSHSIDDERDAILKGLIEADDWQGIVPKSLTHNNDASSMGSSPPRHK